MLNLAAALDLFSRKSRRAMAPTMAATLVSSVSQMAIAQPQPPAGPNHAPLLWRSVCDLSIRRYCTDMDCMLYEPQGQLLEYAVMGRFLLSLKMERICRQNYANQDEAICDIADYIIESPNTRQLHSKLAYQSPNAFERQMTGYPSITASEIT